VKISGRLSKTTLGDVLGSLCRAKLSGLVQLTETDGITAGRVHGIHLSRGKVVCIDAPENLEALFALRDAAVSFHVACPVPPAGSQPIEPGELLRGRPRARDRKRPPESDREHGDPRGAQRREALRVLGLDDDADVADIARAFRALAATLHPDRHRGATESEQLDLHRRFAAASAAYHRLAS
jgi:DnaJ domain